MSEFKVGDTAIICPYFRHKYYENELGVITEINEFDLIKVEFYRKKNSKFVGEKFIMNFYSNELIPISKEIYNSPLYKLLKEE